MATVESVIKALSKLDPKEEIVVAWWTFWDLEESWEDNNSEEDNYKPLTKEVWKSVASGEFDTEGTYDDIYSAIENELEA
jgi:hypothetical protein